MLVKTKNPLYSTSLYYRITVKSSNVIVYNIMSFLYCKSCRTPQTVLEHTCSVADDLANCQPGLSFPKGG